MSMYDLNDFEVSFSSGYDRKSIEKLLDRMFISTPEEQGRHQKLNGVARPPQDIPDSMFVRVWQENEPHTTIRGKIQRAPVEWKRLRGLAVDILRNNNVDYSSMITMTFRYKKDADTESAEKVWGQFLSEITDYLDYIVKSITDDKANGITIDMVSYAEHAHLNNTAKLEFIVLFRISNVIKKDGKKVTRHDYDLMRELFAMFHDYLASTKEKG